MPTIVKGFVLDDERLKLNKRFGKDYFGELLERIFDSVIVVTDRVVLDQQLQDNIYQFEHKRGVVQKIDESSRQLAEALESAVPIIITTLQKFPFVSRQLREPKGSDP